MKHGITNGSGTMRTLIVAVICLRAMLDSVSAQPLSLDSCYVWAKRNYPLIKQHALIEKSKEYTLSNASKAYLPQVSVTAIAGYLFGELPLGPATGEGSSGDFKFIGIAQVNQTIWDGGATKSQREIITASSEVDKASWEVAMYDLYARVNQLYFGILLVDEQMKQLEVQNTILTNNVNRIKQLADNGLVYKTDLDEIRVEQLKLSQKRTELNYVRNGYVQMLSLLTGAKISAETTFQKPTLPNQFVEVSIARPELTLYANQRNLVNAQSSMQSTGMMPKVGLLGAGIMMAPGIGASTGSLSLGVAGLNASWSIGGLYKNRNDKKLTQQSLGKIDVQEELFRFNTKFQVTQATANIEKQNAILAADEEIVALRKSIRESYQLKYDTGISTLTELLNATENESEASSQRALHEMQLLITLAEYKITTGNLK